MSYFSDLIDVIIPDIRKYFPFIVQKNPGTLENGLQYGEPEIISEWEYMRVLKKTLRVSLSVFF